LLNKVKNNHLHEEFANYINEEAVRDAYHVLIGAVVSLDTFECYPEHKGEISDFRFYTDDGKQLFAFIINKQSLLFYLRLPAVQSKKYQFDKIVQYFDEVNENTASVALLPSLSNVADNGFLPKTSKIHFSHCL